MGRKRLTPPAASLMQSIRGVGYDTKTALADLIDNSITASAATVWLKFNWARRDSSVLLLDDGHGMSVEELEQAMVLGSSDPLLKRSDHDLGRFGLGLKTASLSQCSRLLVASRRAGEHVSVRIWDLQTVTATNDWLVEDEPTESERALLAPLENLAAGTLVLWSHLDRLVGDVSDDDSHAQLDFQRAAGEVESHLAMTFHRFLDGPRPRLRLFLNGDTDEFRVRPWDPFCTSHPATQQMPEVRRASIGGSVTLQGYVLPHKDRLDQEEYERAGGPAGWISQQGFYVYRNERLLVPGSWLGLGGPRRWTKDEQHKLARLRLDLPNSLDSAWSLDVKKSKARPPLELRDWLRRNAQRVREEAREVFVHRGNRGSSVAQAVFSPAWCADAGGSPKYRINRSHPLVAEVLEGSGTDRARLERMLRLLESTVPVHRIWLDVGEKPDAPPSTREQLPIEEVKNLANDLLERLMTGQRFSRAAAINRLRHTEPFDQFPEVLDALEL